MAFFARMRRIIKTHLGSTDKPRVYIMVRWHVFSQIYILKPKGLLTILFPNPTDAYSWWPMGLTKVLKVLPLETALHDPQTGARRLKASATWFSTTWRHSLGDRSWTAGMFIWGEGTGPGRMVCIIDLYKYIYLSWETQIQQIDLYPWNRNRIDRICSIDTLVLT